MEKSITSFDSVLDPPIHIPILSLAKRCELEVSCGLIHSLIFL